jgi:hypothetical protein
MEIFEQEPIAKPQLVKKFYLVEYFYILLKSVESNSDLNSIFESFRSLKHKYQLGESKYKKLTLSDEDLSNKQLTRYIYTLSQVISETVDYNLIKEDREKNTIEITKNGAILIEHFENDRERYREMLLKLMEQKYNAFYHLINLCYRINSFKQGLLVLPIYSPLKLGFVKKEITKTGHILSYIDKLTSKLQEDLKKFTGKSKRLSKIQRELIDELIADGYLINENLKSDFDLSKYNSILKKIRSYWLNYILKNIYNYTYSFDTFNIWVERGKQLGILQSTEFYPGINGRTVYPTAIIRKEVKNRDFKEAYSYSNKEKLFLHAPKWKENEELFVDTLHSSYFELRKNRNNNLFVNLTDLREKVCYKLRIPTFVFDDFLNKTYLLNLKGHLKIQISLEADRLPQETSAMYLKREPVLINGKYKNIIAIDYKK